MSRVLWDWGYGESLTQFRTAVDRLFESFAGELPRRSGWESFAYPPIALSEEGDRFVVEAELPGVRMNDLEITCLESNLTLRGERKDSGDPEESYERRERPTGSFVRTIELPSDVDAGKVSAALVDGILRITVPKGERAKPRRIEIKGGAAATEMPEPPTMKEEE
jgi:HSP20 family protein